MFHFNFNMCWSDRKHCVQWNCTPEIVYSKLWQREEPRCNCVLSCVFVLKSICYSFILLNFEFNLLYWLKISTLSNYAGAFSSATQIAMFGSSYTQWWLQHCIEFTRNLMTSYCVRLLFFPCPFVEFSSKVIHALFIPLLSQNSDFEGRSFVAAISA